jgi:hypothetical protein
MAWLKDLALLTGAPMSELEPSWDSKAHPFLL